MGEFFRVHWGFVLFLVGGRFEWEEGLFLAQISKKMGL